jgi:hypothetical protein
VTDGSDTLTVYLHRCFADPLDNDPHCKNEMKYALTLFA